MDCLACLQFVGKKTTSRGLVYICMENNRNFVNVESFSVFPALI